MTEKLPEPSKEASRIPSDEELNKGFYLKPEETVVFEIKPNSHSAVHGYEVGNGIKVSGKAVAELRIGNDTEFVTGLVINTFDAPGKRHDIFVLYSPSDGRTFSAELERGEMWGIGREFEGQDFLPDNVSRDHCAVGLDDVGRFVIENHNPTNFTATRRFS